MVGKFYSALLINRRLFPEVHQVFKPRFNKEYFKRLTANIEQLDKLIEKRSVDPSERLDKDSLVELKRDSKKYLELKNRLDSIKDESPTTNIVAALEELEEVVFPKVVSMPNRFSKNVPQTDTILGQVKSDWPLEGVTKMISHIKLSYINGCYSKSVVGHNSSYYFGIAAKLHHGIRDYFQDNLEKHAFIPVSGLCLARSAVVEAVNSRDHKKYTHDPCRILSEDSKFTTNHLVEASRESLVGFLTTLGHRSSNKSLRLLTSGAAYCQGSDWFDSDDKRASQFETIHTLVHSPSIETYSMAEYTTVRDIIWDLYEKLGLPVRLVHCSLPSMHSNEYDAHKIEIWLPSRSQWIETARISHYLDHITVRSGMRRGHIIDSKIYDSRALVAAIIENNQTSIGKFVIPTVIEGHMPHLKDSERDGYLRQPGSIPEMIAPMLNHQQKRYLKKKPYLFAHSRKAHDTDTERITRVKLLCLVFVFMMCYSFIDWECIWYDYLPRSWQRFLYDKVIRPFRRAYQALVYVDGAVPPPDLSFDEIDKTEYHMTRSERARKYMEPNISPGRLFPPRKDEIFANDPSKKKDGADDNKPTD